MRRRTPSEIKAYGDGYAEAYKEFCHLLKNHDVNKAMRKMKIFANAVALTVETAIDEPSNSEKPNNCKDWQDWKDRMWAEAIVTEPTISKMEQVDKDINVRSKDEPTTKTETQNSNLTFEKADEPQTERYCTNCKHNGVITDYECRECHGMDKHEFIEPQTERSSE